MQGDEFRIIFDNSVGQKNINTIVKLLVWLIKIGYFKEVNAVFLIVGLTKNAPDKLFNNLKMIHHKVNIDTMKEFFQILSASGRVTVHPAEPSNFQDWKS